MAKGSDPVSTVKKKAKKKVAKKKASKKKVAKKKPTKKKASKKVATKPRAKKKHSKKTKERLKAADLTIPGDDKFNASLKLMEDDPKAYMEQRERGMAFSEKLVEGIKDQSIPIDTGHNEGMKYLFVEREGMENYGLNHFLSKFNMLGLIYQPSDTLMDAFAKGETLDEPEALDGTSDYHGCNNCGIEVLQWMFDGKKLTVQGEPCPHPDGLPPYTVEIDCPSGKLLFGNDFRTEYDPDLKHPDDGDLMGNGAYHSWKVFQTYGAIGMGHGFVGNSCPTVWQHSKTKVGIWNIGHEPHKDDRYDGPEITPKEGKSIGSICTDLWWYSIVDLDDYIAHGGATELRHDCIAKVKPGRYRITHKAHTHDRDDYHALQDYALIERIGDCQES